MAQSWWRASSLPRNDLDNCPDEVRGAVAQSSHVELRQPGVDARTSTAPASQSAAAHVQRGAKRLSDVDPDAVFEDASANPLLFSAFRIANAQVTVMERHALD